MTNLGGEGIERSNSKIRRLFLCIIIYGFVSWFTISYSRLLPTTTNDYNYNDNHDDDNNSPRLHRQQLLSPLHASFALSGADPVLFEEFEVSLKSVLLNAPLDRNLFIHILADDQAYQRLEDVFNRTDLSTWVTRNQIEIHAYDIEPHLEMLEGRIKHVFSNMGPDFNWVMAIRDHTMGTFFRLIAHLFLPPSVEHLLYIDTDVVVLSNLEGIVGQVQRKPDALLHWGKGMNAGFIVVNVRRMDDIWALARETPLKNISKQFNKQGVDDQLVLMSVNVTHPNEVNILDPGWEVVNTLHWGLNQSRLDKLFPNTGMLHINGQGTGMAFEGGRVDNFPTTWGNAKYYVTLPWTWARYMAKNMVRVGSDGHLLNICYWGTVKSNNDTLL